MSSAKTFYINVLLLNKDDVVAAKVEEKSKGIVFPPFNINYFIITVII